MPSNIINTAFQNLFTEGLTSTIAKPDKCQRMTNTHLEQENFDLCDPSIAQNDENKKKSSH